MLSRRHLVAGALALSACRPRGSAKAPAPDAFACYAGDGTPTELARFAERCHDADLVAFGELHEHPAARRAELELLTALLAQPRPVALALEFFERDTQPALDDYLAGRIDEATMRERTARTDAYEQQHRALVEACKRAHAPVIAANSPRRLVTAYRKQSLPYPEWLAARSEADRAMMPASSEPPHDEHERRFMALMGPQRGPAFWKSMALWNDAMAESIASFRASHPEHRVLLVVGAFHVAARLGTITAYLARRPDDRVAVASMIAGSLAFADADRDEGDLLIKVP
jgi:uncharacterized iron-regulated protein